MSTSSSVVSVQTIVNLARQEANMELDQFVSDDELKAQAVLSIRDLWDILIDAGEPYAMSKLDGQSTDSARQITMPDLVGNQSRYDLPDDFYKLLGIDYFISGFWVRLEPIPFNNRNAYRFSAGLPAGYQLFGRQSVTPGVLETYIQILPEEVAPTSNYRVFYVPKPQVPVNSADKVDGLNGYERYCICAVAVYALRKKHILDRAQDLRQEQADIEQKIRNASAVRNLGQPNHVGGRLHVGKLPRNRCSRTPFCRGTDGAPGGSRARLAGPRGAVLQSRPRGLHAQDFAS